MPTTADVVAAARAWIGTPFVSQQRRRGLGVDCGGLVLGVARDLGLIAEGVDFLGYGRAPDPVSMRKFMDTQMDRVTDAVRPGDVLLLRLHGIGNHCGIVGDGGTLANGFSLIHTSVSARRVTEVDLDDRWLTERVQTYRLRGVQTS